MPRIRSKQIKGETPINPDDLVNKHYVDDALQKTGGSITIEDEGNIIATGATILNFIGQDVNAQLDPNGDYKVNIFIPAPTYAPYFNTDDTIVSDIPTTNRHIASPTSEGDPFKIGDWVVGEIHSTIRNSVVLLSYTTTNVFSLSTDSTTFTVNVYDADGVNILRTNNIIIDSNQTVTDSNIEITSANFSVDSDKFKSSISILVDIETILPNGGRFSIELIHDNGIDGIFKYTQNNIFRDSETITTDIGGTLSITPAIPIIKTISGVKYYTTNSEWAVSIGGINYLNSNTYPITQQVRIEDNNFYISEIIDIHGNGGSYYTFDTFTWNTRHDNIDSEFNKNNWTTDSLNFTNWQHIGGGLLNTNGRVTLYDWVQTVQAFSQNYNYLIDTLVDDSDRNSERFRSEVGINYPRLQSDLTTNWDNTEALTVNNGLQILGDRLVYPQYNFVNYLPNISGDGNDYTTLNSDREYIRKFDTNNSLFVGNGKILLSDHNITESDILNDIVKIELTIDDGITWLTFKGQFGLYPNSCRVYVDSFGLIGNLNEDNNSMAFTFGNPPNNYSNHIKLKITFTYAAKDKYIGGIDILNNEIDGGNEWA